MAKVPGLAVEDVAFAHEYWRPILRPAAARAFALASDVPIRESFNLAIFSDFFGFFSLAALSHESGRNEEITQNKYFSTLFQLCKIFLTKVRRIFLIQEN